MHFGNYGQRKRKKLILRKMWKIGITFKVLNFKKKLKKKKKHNKQK